MKKYVYLFSLVVCMIIFTSFNPKDVVHAQEQGKPVSVSETTLHQAGFKYSVDEIKKRLSDPSSHYKEKNAFPKISAGEWKRNH
ncbi:hypothetical protein [Aneurinibacillus sp. REN35]|uniref:hypothetical protein n=1 Tax=Aneurinibacillus sp. REN35 TaxID=3237286 RepID=UPI003526C68C